MPVMKSVGVFVQQSNDKVCQVNMQSHPEYSVSLT